MAVQVNGKLRAAIVAPKDADKDAVIAIAMKEERVAASLEGKTIVKEIVVPNKIVNFVVR
jgi:leucyl-tRNA synthetase